MGANDRYRRADFSGTDGTQDHLAILEAKLEQSLKRLAARDSIMASLSEGLLIVNCDGALEYMNPAAAQMLGYHQEELIGRDVHSSIAHHHPDGREYPHAECPFLRVVETSTPSGELPEWFVRKDGTFIPVMGSAAPIREGDEIVGAVFLFRDVSQQRASDRALRAEENRRAAIFRASIDAIITIDHVGIVVDFNPAAERIFGYTRAQIVGKRMADYLIPARFREAHNRGMTRFVETGETRVIGHPIELGGLRADGSEFLCELIITLIPDENPPLFTGFIRDISRDREREQTLRFLFDLNQATMRLSEPADVTAVIARLLAEHLNANRCIYAEIDPKFDHFLILGEYFNYSRGAPPLIGRLPAADFGPELLSELQQGRTFVLDNVSTDPRTRDHAEAFLAADVLALIGAPLVKNGKLVAVLAVHQTGPRRWRESEIELVRTVADRCWDALERARSQKSLQESEARFRAVAENIAQLAWMAHRDGNIFWYNQRWYDYTGSTFEEMEGLGWEKAHHPDHVARVKAKYAAAFAAGRIWEDLFPLRGADGTYRWFLSRALPIRDDAGNVVRWFGTNTDVTELRETQLALRRSEERLRLIVENVRDFALVSTDTDGIITDWNPGAEDVFGWRAAEAQGQSLGIIFTPEDRAAKVFEREMIRARDHGGNADERWHIRKDGTRLFVTEALRAVQNERGELVGFNKVARDITRRQELEQELREARENLEELVRRRTAALEETIGELEAFSYSIAHDMRAPLRAMHQYAEIVQSELGESATGPTRLHLERIVFAAKRLDQLIQDVLSYSRVTRESLLLAPVDLDRLVRQTLSDYPRPAGAEVIVADTLPPVRAHEALLTQCISNLLSNGFKFVAAGIAPRVQISAEDRGDAVRVWFEDNGIGIPAKDRARIFDIFVRVHSTQRYPGTGTEHRAEGN